MLSFRPGIWPLTLMLLCSVFTAAATAGMLELKNGDRIAGEFVRASEDHLEWRAELLGHLRIHKNEIFDISTSKPLKIDGVGEPCLVQGMERELLVYVCGGEPEPRRIPLVSLAMIIPYEELISGETGTFRGRVNLSGSYARGNSTRDDWRLTSNLEYRQVDWRHAGNFEYASYTYGDSDPDLELGIRYSVDWFFRERWFLSNDIRAGKDETRSINRYYNIGSGTGYQFWENPITAFSLSGGLAYVEEEYELPNNPAPDFVRREQRLAYRLSTDFRYQLPLGVSFFHYGELVRSFEEDRDWQLTTTTGVNTMIAGMLRSEVRLEYDVDNAPQQNTERENRRLVVGLSYEW